MELKFTTADPQIQENTEQLFALLRDDPPPEAEIIALIEAGVDVGARDGTGHTALHRAARRDRTESVLLLLAAGADIEAKGLGGSTPLQMAATYADIETARLLLEHGADLEARNDKGETALHWAVIYVKKRIVPLLLERGANIWALDKESKTALDWAAQDWLKHMQAETKGHTDQWQPRYDDFCKGEYTPQTPAEWLGLASVMKLSDTKAYSSVADRVAQLMDWHKGLKSLRSRAASPTIGGLEV